MFYDYTPISKLKELAEANRKALAKKNPNIEPVIVTGRKMANTWWGQAWNENLERYADYNNRIERGRAYVKNGFILDMQIKNSFAVAIVQGSRKKPYDVIITVKSYSDTKWQELKKNCSNSISSMEMLLEGTFPYALASLFTDLHTGLFPSPCEIDFTCTCPDRAYMCKHVAAALYGIGVRFDKDPTLFFVLRNINFNELIHEAIETTKADIVKKSKKKSKRIIEDVDLDDLFGV